MTIQRAELEAIMERVKALPAGEAKNDAALLVSEVLQTEAYIAWEHSGLSVTECRKLDRQAEAWDKEMGLAAR